MPYRKTRRSQETLARMRAGKDAARMARPVPERAPELPELRRRLIVIDFDFGEKIHTLDLYRTNRVDCYRVVMAMRWGIVDFNPCKGVARNTETPRDRLVTDRELCGFIAHNAGSETGTLLGLSAWLAYLTVQRAFL